MFNQLNVWNAIHSNFCNFDLTTLMAALSQKNHDTDGDRSHRMMTPFLQVRNQRARTYKLHWLIKDQST
jgi:hypothetical protein